MEAEQLNVWDGVGTEGKRPRQVTRCRGTSPTEEHLCAGDPVKGDLTQVGWPNRGARPHEWPVYKRSRKGKPVTPKLCTAHGTLTRTFELGLCVHGTLHRVLAQWSGVRAHLDTWDGREKSQILRKKSSSKRKQLSSSTRIEIDYQEPDSPSRNWDRSKSCSWLIPNSFKGPGFFDHNLYSQDTI